MNTSIAVLGVFITVVLETVLLELLDELLVIDELDDDDGATKAEQQPEVRVMVPSLH